jgi:two-component system copper resistance phosphate regulon response regulator CusR
VTTVTHAAAPKFQYDPPSGSGPPAQLKITMDYTPFLDSRQQEATRPSNPVCPPNAPEVAALRPPAATERRRILITEDDVSLANFLSYELELTYEVELVHDGEEALAAIRSDRRYDLLILDLNLPKLDGLALIGELRPTHANLPVLVLTARNRTEDKVAALQCGADDCLTKPFSLIELIARVQALMRRHTKPVAEVLTVGDLCLYRQEHRVVRNGRRIDLTPREFAILEVMMRNAGRPVSRATLLAEVWNTTPEASTNIVDVYMKYVRDKVDGPNEPRLTHTIRGFGYELRDASAI